MGQIEEVGDQGWKKDDDEDVQIVEENPDDD